MDVSCHRPFLPGITIIIIIIIIIIRIAGYFPQPTRDKSTPRDGV